MGDDETPQASQGSDIPKLPMGKCPTCGRDQVNS